MYDVAVAPCADYTPDACRAALKAVFDPIGGLDFVKAGMKIAIKANLVSYMKPDQAATTHPELLIALVEMLKERGANAVIGDSPGGLYNSVFVGRVYSATGMHSVAQAGAELNHDFSQKDASFPEATVAKTFRYTGWLDDCDAIINFCKVKSHGMMGMSAAAKNLFGTIPGTLKPEYHFRFPDPRDFARMIVDLNDYWKPALSIADAVVGMEGNGPTAGTPRHIGAVLASKNAHFLDLACAKLIGLKREDVPTLEAAFERGYIPETADMLTVSGDLDSLVVPDFEHLETRNSLLFKDTMKGKAGSLFGGIAQKALCSKPKVKKTECIGCAKCANICPAKAIGMKKKLPHIDRSKCIRCFCCQEFCPKGAMKVARPAIAKILNK